MNSIQKPLQQPTHEVLFPSPRSLYLHVPFCLRKCGYCNFTVVAGREDLIDRYLDAIEQEMASHLVPHSMKTIYFGGGTPTQLPAPAMARLLQMTKRWFPPEKDYEWTVEANPADLDQARLEVLAQGGVNRISLGVQSFRDEKLVLLERDHRLNDIHRAHDMVRPLFKQICLDLIFAAPGESLDQWEHDLQQALALAPDHLSTYGLTYERGSNFWGKLLKGEFREIDDSLQRQMYEGAIDQLAAAGWDHYEVSNFARPGCRSRHNEVYWLGGGYYGVGPGAARFVDGVRSSNHQSTTTWIRRIEEGKSPIAESEQLSHETAIRERLVFGLRRLEGVDLAALERVTGCDIQALVGDKLNRYQSLGLLLAEGDHLRLTREGLLLSDSLAGDLLDEESN